METSKFLLAGMLGVLVSIPGSAATLKPGDLITPESAALVADLVSPGNFVLVKQGMRMKIVPTGHLEWPPPYKAATEKYSAQVKLNERGELNNYVAGLPFPMLDPDDPQAAIKAMWNFSYRPEYTDDVDIRDVEWIDRKPSGDTFDHIVLSILRFTTTSGAPRWRPSRPTRRRRRLEFATGLEHFPFSNRKTCANSA